MTHKPRHKKYWIIDNFTRRKLQTEERQLNCQPSRFDHHFNQNFSYFLKNFQLSRFIAAN